MTGAVTLACPGFNDKNDYDRQTPCDQDFLRKFARDNNLHLTEVAQGAIDGSLDTRAWQSPS